MVMNEVNSLIVKSVSQISPHIRLTYALFNVFV